MNRFLIVFLVCIVLLIIFLFIYAKMGGFKQQENDDFLDEHGRHVYYDRSLIKKEKFKKENPDVPFSEIRSIKRIFKNRSHKQNND